MNWRTNKLYIALRGGGRALGLNRLLGRLLNSGEYEEKFSEAMLGLIAKDHVVWDVGANVGLYTKQFADIVGDAGKVIAFEPSPANRKQLETNLKSLKNVQVVPAALSGETGTMKFLEVDDGGVTSRIVTEDTGGNCVDVEVVTADGLLSEDRAPVPNFMKIDTEGFELDVLNGMNDLLKEEELKAVCIEVHFGRLGERGMPNAPREIEKRLTDAGFATSWADASHIIASRK
ncbi:MAG: FkbM family methyltransferase [Limisphaerales bacterium]